MFYFHVLLSCTIIIYCDYVLFSHIIIMYRHILGSCTTFINCIHVTLSIYHVRSYNLMLQNLSSHSSAMLLISYHIFLHVIFKSFILCFMPVNTKEVDTRDLKRPEGAILTIRNSGIIRAQRRCTHCTK